MLFRSITGEAIAYACEKLLDAGALDVWCTPIHMKKGRPGQMLSVLARPEDEPSLAELIFQHTTSLGVRVWEQRRHVMKRSVHTVKTSYGNVEIKEAYRGNSRKAKPEFESLRKIADEKNLTISQIAGEAYCEFYKKS